MYLTIAEAATLLGRSPRSIRYQIRAQKLPAVQKGKIWMVDASVLPLTEAQRERVQAQRAQIRNTVEKVLIELAPAPTAEPPQGSEQASHVPPDGHASASVSAQPSARTARPSYHSVLSLDVLKLTLDLHQALLRVQPVAQESRHLVQALQHCEDAVQSFCQFTHMFETRVKQESLGQARQQLAAVLGHLLLHQNEDAGGCSRPVTAVPLDALPPPPSGAGLVAHWQTRLEAELLPSLGALLRKVEKRR